MEALRLQKLKLLGILFLVNSAVAAPNRIISLAPNITEILFALEVGDRVVARTRYCEYPPAAAKLPQIGGITDPSVEVILALKPDLVIVSKLTPLAAYQQLQRLKLPMLAIEETGLKGVFLNIETIAIAIGKPTEGKKLIHRMQQSMHRLKERALGIAGNQRPRTLLLSGTSSYFCAGKSSFTGEILEMVGAKNVAPATSQPWPPLSIERIMAENPQVIIISLAHQDNEQQLARKQLDAWRKDPLWKQLDAIRNNRVHFIGENMLTIPGPRIAEAASILAKHIHGQTRNTDRH
jgi:iron complex transport system substrate-binding protein